MFFSKNSDGTCLLQTGSNLQLRRRLRDARVIGEVEILRDDRAPAVRAEFDCCHARSLAETFPRAKHSGFQKSPAPGNSKLAGQGLLKRKSWPVLVGLNMAALAPVEKVVQFDIK
jgi:hypothetical protein